MNKRQSIATILAIGYLWVSSSPGVAQANVKLEALRRLEGLNLDANPSLKQTVTEILKESKGSPAFVELAIKFKLETFRNDLLPSALAIEDRTGSVNALRHILDSEAKASIEAALDDPEETQTTMKLIDLLGASGSREAASYLKAIILREGSIDTRRRAVTALVSTRQGAQAILDMAQSKQLAPRLKLTAASSLAATPWNRIREQASTILPLPLSADMQNLPPLSELIQQEGNIAEGEKVFNRPTSLCSICHVVLDKGIDFGPNLTEIGDKLGKDALFEAILSPSAGISFDYEIWDVSLKNGDEATGIIVSDTETELAIKSQAGIVTRYPKSDVTSKVKQSRSGMPEGLQMTMSQADLVNLVSYLTSLRKKALDQ